MTARKQKILTGVAGSIIAAGAVLINMPATKSLTVRQTVLRIEYPPEAYINNYYWSLEFCTNLASPTWQVATNYPLGYTNDVWITNDYSPAKFFRMHGHL